MNPAIISSAGEPTRSNFTHTPFQNLFSLLLLVCTLFFSINAWAGKPAGSGGGKPPPSAALILPVSLGTPAECTSSEATGLNNGAYPDDLVVTAATSGCSSQFNRPYRWHGGYWNDLGTLPGASGGMAYGVSDDGTVVGYLTGNVGIAFVAEDGAMVDLPLLGGMVHASATGISEDGSVIFGDNAASQSAWSAVRWYRVGADDWTVQGIGDHQASGSSDDGTVIVGNGAAGAWIWIEGKGAKNLLSGTVARDIAPTGQMIVGYRWESCGTSCEYKIPIYWVLESGEWNPHDLPALDGADSEASGVGKVGNRLVIVGYGYTRKDAIMRAVAWLPQSGGGYGAPIRLEALGGKSKAWARAEDVNKNGVIAGTSQGNGLKSVAVIWVLQ